MSTYTPDRWVMLKLSMPSEPKPVFKILAGWVGGYLSGDSWKLSSGTTDAMEMHKEGTKVLRFGQCSGSEYVCCPESYGLTAYTSGILDGWLQDAKKAESTIKIEIMEENFDLDQDWLK
jgi:hypothetical protein